MLRIFGVSLQNCKLFRLFVGFALPPWPPCATSATELLPFMGREEPPITDSSPRERKAVFQLKALA